MPRGLVRHHHTGNYHFITFSCDGRKPYLVRDSAKYLFEQSLEKMRVRYQFVVGGYVVMPEHVHLLLSEPGIDTLATVIQAVKLSVSVQSQQRPFWLKRYHDFTVATEDKRIEKLVYMHNNPVKRGLVADLETWPWSSYQHHKTGLQGTVEIESDWTALKRQRSPEETHVSEARHGAPQKQN